MEFQTNFLYFVYFFLHSFCFLFCFLQYTTMLFCLLFVFAGVTELCCLFAAECTVKRFGKEKKGWGVYDGREQII